MFSTASYCKFGNDFLETPFKNNSIRTLIFLEEVLNLKRLIEVLALNSDLHQNRFKSTHPLLRHITKYLHSIQVVSNMP